MLAPEPPLDPAGDPEGAGGHTVRAYGDIGATGLSLRFRHDSRAHYLEQLEAMVEVAASVDGSLSGYAGRVDMVTERPATRCVAYTRLPCPTPLPVDSRPSLDAARAAEFLALGAATVGESGGRPMRARIRAVWPGARLAAPAFPVRCTPGDNLAIHVAVAQRAASAARWPSTWGTRRSSGTGARCSPPRPQTRGLAGLVIDGGVRDTSALEAHGFPVFSTTVALRGASKNRPGIVGSPVDVGGVSVAAGDWLVGDADGVAVVRAAAIDDVLGCRPGPRRQGRGHVRGPAPGSDDPRAPRASTPRRSRAP